ncbi:MAG TPA: ABC transporter permease [Bordetella sp.]
MSIFKKLLKNRLFTGMVIIPMLIIIIYFVFLARDRYVSTSSVVVRSESSDSGSSTVQLPGIASLLGGGGGGASMMETLYVNEFVNSQDMLDILQKKLQWNQHYAGNWLDSWYFLPTDAPQEDQLKYYQRMITTNYNEVNGLLTIKVQSFDPAFAKKTLDVIISESDKFVNELSHKMAREQVAFAQEELERARKTYEQKRKIMLDFQSAHNVLDAQQSAISRNEVISTLQSNLTNANATLRAMRATLSENSPQVNQQKVMVIALQQQIAAEEQKLVAKTNNNQLNVIASQYHALEVDAGIAEDNYKATVASLESARVEATKKLRSMSVIVSPNMPDDNLYPRRAFDIFTVLVILLLLYGIAIFFIATIKDHQD